MPPISRWYLRSAMAWLVFGWAAYLAVNQGAPEMAPAVRVGFLHALTVGWITQLIFGVALWLFPKHPGPNPRGPATLNWLSWVALNIGLPLRVVAEPWLAWNGPGAWASAALTLSGWLQCAAAVAWSVSVWPRIR